MSSISTKLAAILSVTFTAIVCCAQSINPVNQINWPGVTGSGAPTAACQATYTGAGTAAYGEPYTDTTNNNQYVCTGAGWLQIAVSLTGVLPIANGSTGATTQAGAFTNIVGPGGTLTGALSSTYTGKNSFSGTLEAGPSGTQTSIASTGVTFPDGTVQSTGASPTEVDVLSATGAITLPTKSFTAALYVLAGNVTASIGPGVPGAYLTVVICQPSAGGPFTWTWPPTWSSGITIGKSASQCSQQTAIYLSALSTWKGGAGEID